MGATATDGTWTIPGGAGGSAGEISHAWGGGAAVDLFGRCLDLKHAYKQFVRNPKDNWSSVLAVDMMDV